MFIPYITKKKIKMIWNHSNRILIVFLLYYLTKFESIITTHWMVKGNENIFILKYKSEFRIYALIFPLFILIILINLISTSKANYLRKNMHNKFQYLLKIVFQISQCINIKALINISYISNYQRDSFQNVRFIIFYWL